MSHRFFRTALAVSASVIAFLAPVPAAHATTSYTWTAGMADSHADHHSWTDPANWSPQGIPGNGDAVVIASIPNHTSYIDAVPNGLSLSALTLAGGDHDTHLGTDGGSFDVTGSFYWTGGELLAPLTLGASAAGSIAAGHLKQLTADLTDSGRLTIDNIGAESLKMWQGHQIQVGATGTLVSKGVNGITYDACCGNPNKLVNHGLIDVQNGTLELSRTEFDNLGTLRVAAGGTLHDRALARLSGSYDGGGLLLLDGLVSPEPDPQHPTAPQGAALISGTNTLSNGFHVMFGDGASLTGTGTFRGNGTVHLSGGVVYADLGVGTGTRLAVDGATTSRVGVWSSSLTGYHGRIVVSGSARVAPGSTLQLDPGTRTTIARGARFDVASMIASGNCCSSAPTLTTSPGSSLNLNSHSRLKWLTVQLAGTTHIPARAGVALERTTLRQIAGTTMVGAGSHVSGSAWQLLGGTLSGTGTVSTLLNTHGTVAPGLGRVPGVLHTGSYRQTRSGRLLLSIRGRHADRLATSGTATLSGTVQTSGKRVRRVTYVVVSGRRVKGKFSRVSARGLRVAYGRRSVRLRG